MSSSDGMNRHLPEGRAYRQRHTGADLTYFNIKIQETDLHIGASLDLSREAYLAAVEARNRIQLHIARRPEFLTSIDPLEPIEDSPEIVLKMYRSSRQASVGPMAAVAGAIAEYVGESLLKYSHDVIVENGGDIYLASIKERLIAIYAGESPFSWKTGIKIHPQQTPIGICTSSGKIGHSLSMGKADAAMVLSNDTFLADACATRLGNMIQTKDDLERALDTVLHIPGVIGAVGIIGDRIAAIGEIELTAIS
jgi:uncharacterized protein